MDLNLNESSDSPNVPVHPACADVAGTPVENVRTSNGEPVGWLSDVTFDPQTKRVHFSVDLFSDPLILEARRMEDEANERARRRAYAGAWVAALISVLVIGTAAFVIARRGPSATSADIHHAAAVMERTSLTLRDSAADATTTAKVKTALALSKRVRASDVSVDTFHAVATLTGTVPSIDARTLAGEIAADTSGVREVRNFLTVDDGQTP